MITVLTFLHVIICVLLVAVVLLQKSKGDGLSGAFGGGGALTASFGSRGAAEPSQQGHHGTGGTVHGNFVPPGNILG